MMKSYLRSDATDSPSSLYLSSIGLVSACAIPVCAALMVLSPFVLAFYGGSFSQHSTPFRILIVATGIQALSIPAMIVIQVRGDFWIFFACNLIWAALFVGYTMAFTADGVLGYARASLIAFAVHSCLMHAWAVLRLRSKREMVNVAQ
jgi:O-antigen/teichoic acid export membrane protein